MNYVIIIKTQKIPVIIVYIAVRCVKDSWAQQQGLNINNSALHDYVTSLYWSTTTMTTVGYGDITPYNDIDKLLAITAMIVGILLYGYILGAIAATLTSSFAPKSVSSFILQSY